jgi:hypothetical protein
MENSQTANPQNVTGSSLQQPAAANLQTTQTQSVPDINRLDGGGQAISLASISNTTTTAPAPAVVASSRQNWWLYGGMVVLVVAFFVIVYRKVNV